MHRNAVYQRNLPQNVKPETKGKGMKLTDMFGGDFLKAADLKGKEVKLTISGIGMELLGAGDSGEQKKKPVLSFKQTDKRLVLNKTNATILATSYGDDTDGWINQTITLYPARVPFKGVMQDAIRLRELPGKPPVHVQDSGDEIPF